MCGVQTIPTQLKYFIEATIVNYTLPYDPCEFNTINTSFIWHQTNLQHYLGVIDDRYWQNSYLLIQEPLSSYLKNISQDYLISYQYWFDNAILNDNSINQSSDTNYTGKCDIYNVTNSLCCNENNSYRYSYRYGCNTSNSDDSNIDSQCFYPFVESPVKQSYTLEYCGLSCNFDVDLSDEQEIDNFNRTSLIISLILTIIYSIDKSVEIKFKLCNKNKNDNTNSKKSRICINCGKLPLTFDCTICILMCSFGMNLIFLMPFVFGKEYFNCDIETQSVLISRTNIIESNWHCAIAGYLTMIYIQMMFNYMALLSFCVFRYLRFPQKALFGISKIWFHLFIVLYTLLLFVATLATNMYDNFTTIALCGPTFTDKITTVLFLLVPGSIAFGITIIFTFLTGINIIKYVRSNTFNSTFKQEWIILSLRLCIYQLFIASACIIFSYAIIKSLIDYPSGVDSWREYLTCLALTREPANPNGDVCSLDFRRGIILYVPGILCLIFGIGHFTVGCSCKTVGWMIQKQISLTSFFKDPSKIITILKIATTTTKKNLILLTILGKMG